MRDRHPRRPRQTARSRTAVCGIVSGHTGRAGASQSTGKAVRFFHRRRADWCGIHGPSAPVRIDGKGQRDIQIRMPASVTVKRQGVTKRWATGVTRRSSPCQAGRLAVIKSTLRFGAWRRLVARLLWEQDAGCSNHLAPTNFFKGLRPTRRPFFGKTARTLETTARDAGSVSGGQKASPFGNP